MHLLWQDSAPNEGRLKTKSKNGFLNNSILLSPDQITRDGLSGYLDAL